MRKNDGGRGTQVTVCQCADVGASSGMAAARRFGTHTSGEALELPPRQTERLSEALVQPGRYVWRSVTTYRRIFVNQDL